MKALEVKLALDFLLPWPTQIGLKARFMLKRYQLAQINANSQAEDQGLPPGGRCRADGPDVAGKPCRPALGWARKQN